ncbi:LamG-like jellyroll fold domain-containing protein [Rubritalea profundi]|uniref:Protein kinase domain-containing protein n=1 Tax=Rubritalea profundi TaxID=1658618 RepID=A0A2S7U204_9BACT|nr:LamG-like jellyroll fold domain-containing protein [Rubritalea profundi]PQJ28424.1 hypothetical protein BSZ32_07810 [Rubritalea profundi]
MDDRYQVGQLIEELAFGNIYEAEDTLIQRKVQIFRYFVPTSSNEAEWKEAFHATSAELATASHPGLPIIYTHGIDDDGPYTIRQLLDSTVLNTRLAESGPLSEFEAWELAYQMLEIHDAAKPSGNFHGALDANHIGLITRPSGKKLYSITDYGLAEVSKRMHDNTDYVGAPYLISPEQAKGEPASELSQIYAIGQLIFHALAGGHPWIQTPLDEIIELQKTDPLGPITEYSSEVPEAMAQWISKLVALEPKDRFQSYEEAITHLPEPIQSAPVPIQATSAIYTVPATHTTAAQTVPADGTGPVSAADAFAAQQKEANAEKVTILKNPLVLAGIGIIVLLITFIIFFTGGSDDDAYESNYVSSEGIKKTKTAKPPRVEPLSTGEDKDEPNEPDYVSSKEADNAEIASLPRDGLFAYISFNDAKVAAINDKLIQLEPLKNEPTFDTNGRNGKGLILDKTHYFRLSLKGSSIANSSTDFTISFWIRPRKSADQDLGATSNQPWMDGETKNDLGNHIWTPEKAVIIGRAWNMVTMASSRSSEEITIYLDGEKVETSSNGEINEISKNPFIYIGCDSSEKSQHASPVIIDNIAIWERKLSDFEIKDLYRN